MKRLRFLLPAMAMCLLLVWSCSKDSTAPGSQIAVAGTNATAASSDTGSAPPDTACFHLGVPEPLASDAIPTGCELDVATNWFVCPASTDEHGSSVSRSYAFFDAAGALQSAYDDSLTASIGRRFSLDASSERDGKTGTLHMEYALMASGLAGDETTRIWNGTMSEVAQGIPLGPGPGGPGGPPPGGRPDSTSPGGPPPGGPDGSPPGGPGGADSTGFDPSNMKMTAASTIADVMMQHPLGRETWPLSGSITRTIHVEGGLNGVEDRTEVITFNGTQYATVTIGERTFTLDLKNPGPPRK